MGAIGSPGPPEPLAETAPLAWAEAPSLCCQNPHTGDSCLWYHRVWQYLRLLDVITSARTNSDFLIQRFHEYARTGEYGRVLISATADYSMLAHLAYAYAQAEQPLDVTVIDRCRTSLLLNRWYAERYGVSLTTDCVDVLEYLSPEPFDLICTHNFLGRFDLDARRRLIAHWYELLRPGGIVVTTQRVRPGCADVLALYPENEARELSHRVGEIARTHSGLTVDADELSQAVYEYAIRKGGYVIRANGEITDLFREQGFDLDQADCGGGAAERHHDRPSSLAGKDTYRLRIVARKACATQV